MEQDLTKGSIKHHYLTYLCAAFGSAMVACVYGMVDAAAVGQYQGPDGAATLSIVMPIWTILYSLGLLIGIGGSVNYAFFKAQGKTNKANAYYTLSFLLTALVSLLCWVGLTVFQEPLLRLFGANDELLVLAKEYLKPVLFVIPTFPFSQFLSAFLRNDNAPGRATFAVLFGGVFNVLGDIFFVFDFGLGLGMFGAGLATAIGCTITNLIMLTHFVSRKNSLRLNQIFGYVSKSQHVITSGFSSFLADIAIGIIAMLFNRQIMGYFGSDALAVYGVIVQVTCVVQCSTYGVGQAVQPLLSANFGAGLWDRITKTRNYSLWTVGIFGLFWTICVLCLPNVFVYLFMSPSERVLEIAPEIMRIYAISYLALPLNIFATYYFPSLGKSGAAMVVSLGRGIVLSGVLLFLLPAVFGSGALWWVMPVTEFIVAFYVITKIIRFRNS